MPEGPEVKKTTVGISSYFKGETLMNIEIKSGRYSKNTSGFGGFEDLKNSLPLKIENIDCKGKFIYFSFDKDLSLWNTLGMTAYWSLNQTKHTRVILSSKTKKLFFNDVRNFGTFKFCDDPNALKKKLASLGPDVLAENIDFQVFKKRLLSFSKSKKTISEALMNQSVLSGIGNYLKAEILYDSKISPHRLCDSLNDLELTCILDSIMRIPKLSYELGGATIKNYRDVNSKDGLYTRRFAVYNQESDPLGNKVIKEATLDKRTTFWVPEIQK